MKLLGHKLDVANYVFFGIVAALVLLSWNCTCEVHLDTHPTTAPTKEKALTYLTHHGDHNEP